MPSYTISDGVWLNTRIDVVAGQTLRFSATGLWAPVDPSFGTPGEFSEVSANGYPNKTQRFSGDQYMNLTDIGSGITDGDLLTQHTRWGALVGFIAIGGEIPPGVGSYPNGGAVIAEQATRVFFIGTSLTYTVPAAGRLYIAQNDDAYSAVTGDNSGEIQVVITSEIDVRCGDVIAATQDNSEGLGNLLYIEFYRNDQFRFRWLVSPEFNDGLTVSTIAEFVGSIINVDSGNNLYIPIWTDATQTGRRVIKFPVTSSVMSLDDTALWWQADTLERCLAASVDDSDNVWVLVSTGNVDPFSATGLKLYKLTTAGAVQSSVSLALPAGQTPGDALGGADINREGSVYYISFFGGSIFPRVQYDVLTGVATTIFSSADRSSAGLEVLPDGQVIEALGTSVIADRIYLALLIPQDTMLGQTDEPVSSSNRSNSVGIHTLEPGKVIVVRHRAIIISVVETQTERRFYSLDVNTGGIRLLFTAPTIDTGINTPVVVLCPKRSRQLLQATLIGAT